MQDFKYKYEKLLKNKLKFEETVKNECLMIKRELDLERIKLVISQDKEKELQRELLSKRAAGNPGGGANDLTQYHKYLIYLSEFISRKKEEIKLLEKKLELKQAELVDAMRDTKTFEKLKTKEKSRYEMIVTAEEQKVNDSSALFRYKTQMIGLN